MPKPSPSEPVSELRRVKIIECGEPLVDYLKDCSLLRQDRPRFDYRRESLMRKGLLERLCRAAGRLPEGYHFAIYEGWRAPLIQGRMYKAIWQQMKGRYPNVSEVQLKRIVNRFSAPMDRRVPPPHTTGGAVDLTLVDDAGQPYELQKPFDLYDDRSFPFDARGIGDEARRNREIMAEALVGEGITNYPSEFWHWSYGDQGWAYRGAHPHAIYGATMPEGWEPDSRDINGEALRFLDEGATASSA